MSRTAVTPCAVIVDEAIERGLVELSGKLFKRYGLKPGDDVSVSRSGRSVRVRARRSDSLKSCEIATDPYLAAFMGVAEGEEVDVQGSLKVERGSGEPSESFLEVLGQPQSKLEPLLGEELRHFSGLTVKEVLEHIIRYGGAHKGSYLVVAPNPEDTGIPRGDLCEDPSLHVKEWDPSGDDE